MHTCIVLIIAVIITINIFILQYTSPKIDFHFMAMKGGKSGGKGGRGGMGGKGGGGHGMGGGKGGRGGGRGGGKGGRGGGKGGGGDGGGEAGSPGGCPPIGDTNTALTLLVQKGIIPPPPSK